MEDLGLKGMNGQKNWCWKMNRGKRNKLWTDVRILKVFSP
jgi:hypothetical protein